MERVLQKLAHQLASYDEASLLALWDKYAAIVTDFEPTRRWEEAVLIFGFIQSVRMKNQLFNRNLAASIKPGGFPLQAGLGSALQVADPGGAEQTSSATGSRGKGVGFGSNTQKRCKILRFRRRKDE